MDREERYRLTAKGAVVAWLLTEMHLAYQDALELAPSLEVFLAKNGFTIVDINEVEPV